MVKIKEVIQVIYLRIKIRIKLKTIILIQVKVYNCKLVLIFFKTNLIINKIIFFLDKLLEINQIMDKWIILKNQTKEIILIFLIKITIKNQIIIFLWIRVQIRIIRLKIKTIKLLIKTMDNKKIYLIINLLRIQIILITLIIYSLINLKQIKILIQ